MFLGFLLAPLPVQSQTAEQMLAKSNALTSKPRCETAADPDAIVICGKKDRDSTKLPALPVAPPALVLPPAEFGLFGNVRAGVHNEQASTGGWVDNRIKVTVKIPF